MVEAMRAEAASLRSTAAVGENEIAFGGETSVAAQPVAVTLIL